MKFKLSYILTLLLFLYSFNPGSSDTQSNNIDPYLQSLIDDYIETEILPINKIPGLSLSIIRNNGSLLYNTGYGYKNMEEQQGTDNKTLFGIGSVSKSFTATIVVKALSEKFPEYGSTVLDMPIQNLLSNVSSQDIIILGDRYRSESATFRDLLSHNTCLNPDMLGIFVGAFQTQQELTYRLRYAKEVCSFRTNFVYNNAVFAMAGEYIGLIMNTTFGELLESLFSDLEMNESTFVTSDLNFSSMPLSKMYYYKDNTHHLYNPDLLKTVAVCPGSGGILSTSSDMSKYLNFHLNYGMLGDKVIIPEDVMRWLYVPANLHRQENSLIDPANVIYGYGLGFNLGISNKHPITSHAGAISTFSTLLSLYPTLNLGIYSSSNGQNDIGKAHEFLHNKIFRIITETNTTKEKLIGGNKEVIANRTLLNHYKYRSNNSSVKREPNEIVGHYGNGYAGELDVIFKNGTGVNDTGLYLKYGSLATGFLRESDDPNIYFVEIDSDLIQEFYARGLDSFKTTIDFNVPEKAILYGYEAVEFDKGLTLDKLPLIPYDPQSCGPNISINKLMPNTCITFNNI